MMPSNMITLAPYTFFCTEKGRGASAQRYFMKREFGLVNIKGAMCNYFLHCEMEDVKKYMMVCEAPVVLCLLWQSIRPRPLPTAAATAPSSSAC